jgi:uncharacterized protein (DUF1919 family)
MVNPENFSLISNNCIGADILHQLHMPFNSPTVNLQILPEEFPKFCQYANEYMDKELVEYKVSDMSQNHLNYLHNMFGNVPAMPYALCGDILICLQHYDTFEEGKAAWDRRRLRFNPNDCGFIFYVRDPLYFIALNEFIWLPLKNAIVFTEGFDADIPIEHYRVDFPDGWHFLNIDQNGIKYYQRQFKPEEWMERIHGV